MIVVGEVDKNWLDMIKVKDRYVYERDGWKMTRCRGNKGQTDAGDTNDRWLSMREGG